MNYSLVTYLLVLKIASGIFGEFTELVLEDLPKGFFFDRFLPGGPKFVKTLANGTDGTFFHRYDATFVMILNDDSNESLHSPPRIRSIWDCKIKMDFRSSSRRSVRSSIVRFRSSISATSCSLPPVTATESECSIISGVGAVRTLSHLLESPIM
jgi:hypothetical protein